MSKLFEPSLLAGLSIRNRSIRSATWEGLADQEGFVRPELIQMLAGLARGGVGMVVAGYLHVSPEGRGLPWQTGVWQDAHVEGLTQVTKAVHEAGGVIVAQIAHAGGRTRPETLGGLTPIAPSAVVDLAFATKPREMSVEDIEELVLKFADAARRVKQAGFDALQLHAAHGYLISQFLSPLTNRRHDDYGGSSRGRHRFLEEVYAAVRKAVGPDFPIFVKMNGADGLPGGIGPQDALETAAFMEALGLDAIEVSGGQAGIVECRPSRLNIRKPSDEAYFRTIAKRFKENLRIPIVLVGGIRSYEVAEEILASGDADYVSLSRPLICEPDLISRWMKADRSPAKCISCNLCLKEGLEGHGISCRPTQ
jgi:2,4-dienoyl-CoA reductase-like NADH-dependent reductase (Old Yellow Enzyme family)